MKFFLFTALLLCLYSCREKENKITPLASQSVDSLRGRSDSFNTKQIEIYPSLQKDIPLDTIEISQTKRHTGIRIEIPVLSQKVDPEVFKQIKELVDSKREEFAEMTKKEVVEYDSAFQYYRGWDMWIEPKSLYRTEKVISFAIESGSGFTGMPSGFEYNTFNFDREKKSNISLGDYFVLRTRADSSFLEKIIQRSFSTGFKLSPYLKAGNRINFSFDDSCVYFYFDKYDVAGWGISSVMKKYILDHISPFYR